MKRCDLFYNVMGDQDVNVMELEAQDKIEEGDMFLRSNRRDASKPGGIGTPQIFLERCASASVGKVASHWLIMITSDESWRPVRMESMHTDDASLEEDAAISLKWAWDNLLPAMDNKAALNLQEKTAKFLIETILGQDEAVKSYKEEDVSHEEADDISS